MQPASELLSDAQRKCLARFTAPRCVDIHCHCLPGLDDGPGTLGSALALCRALVDDGVTTVIATPHQLGRYDDRANRNSPAAVRDAAAALSAALTAEEVPLEVHPGADVRLDERIARLLDEDKILTLADGGRYLLLELPHQIFLDPRRLLRDLESRGVRAILSHPERHEVLTGHPHLVRPWLEEGAILQVTSGSLLGEFGAIAEQAAWEWLESGWVDLVASDAHGATRRPPRMSPAIDLICRRLGLEVARRCCIANPERVLFGQDIAST